MVKNKQDMLRNVFFIGTTTRLLIIKPSDKIDFKFTDIMLRFLNQPLYMLPQQEFAKIFMCSNGVILNTDEKRNLVRYIPIKNFIKMLHSLCRSNRAKTNFPKASIHELSEIIFIGDLSEKKRFSITLYFQEPIDIKANEHNYVILIEPMEL